MNAAQLMEEGINFVRNFNLKDAEECFWRVLAIDSYSAEAIIWLGRIAYMQGEVEKGDRLMDKVLSMNPVEAQALALRGISEVEKGNPTKALEFLNRAEESDSKLQIYGFIARCYSLLDKSNDAEQAALKALQMNAQDTLAHYELASILASRGNMAQALSHLVSSINSNPLFAKGYFALGALLAAAGKTKEAIDVYRKGLSYVPDAHILREQLCTLLFAEGMFQEAVDETNECIRRRNSYEDYLRLGFYQLVLGKFEDAEKAFLKSIELNTEDWEAHYNLGELYSAANLVNESRNQYEAALSKGQQEWKPYNGMGIWILRNGNNPNEAITHFKKANELEKSRPEPLMNLALTYASIRDWNQAKNHCDLVMQRVPSNSKYFIEADSLRAAINAEVPL
ncbi:MAG TPA: tetratricopeptide repeat protein [Acidobacteriota bacterium]|nr:tetratricopeptide repeat protein [Acidobacteriota bacterium]